MMSLESAADERGTNGLSMLSAAYDHKPHRDQLHRRGVPLQCMTVHLYEVVKTHTTELNKNWVVLLWTKAAKKDKLVRTLDL